MLNMAPAAPFNPPPADLPGKPKVEQWVPPPVTQEKENFAKLKSIDLSLLDSDDPAVVNDLIQQVKIAIRDDGFLFLENYGVSLDQVGGASFRCVQNGANFLQQLHRQFGIAQYLYDNISEEDKERLLFSPDKGMWSGYKHPYGFKVCVFDAETSSQILILLIAYTRTSRWYRAVQLVQARLGRHRESCAQVYPAADGRS